MEAARRAVDDRTGAAPGSAARDTSIEFGRLGVPALFAAYVAGDRRALDLFAGDPFSSSDRVAAAERAAAHPRDRDLLADTLAEQNAGWAAPEEPAREHVQVGIETLRDPRSVAVVTGQQLGLFGGPLYTILKALTAVKLSRRITDETGRPAVPVFWLADEDHDFAEVKWTAYSVAERVVQVRYEDGLAADVNRGPVGRIVIGDGILRTLDDLEAGLPDGPFAARVVAGLRAAWRPGERWRDAFARTMRLLLPEAPLVFVSADDPLLKALAGRLFRTEAGDWAATQAALVAGTNAVLAAGFAEQVAPRPLHLFLLDDGQRLALDPAENIEGAVVVRSTGTRLPAGELVTIAETSPERLSPDVILRPVVQDALFPTAAYVAGPGEVAYLAQLRAVYGRFDIPMPLVSPRTSLTLVEPAIRRALDVLGIDVADIHDEATQLHTRLAFESEAPSLDADLAVAEREVEAGFARARAAVVSLDSSLDAAAGAARARARRALATLRLKAERVARRRHVDQAARIDRARAALFPGGALQERALSALGFYVRYGPTLCRMVEDAIDLDKRDHAVVDLP